MKILGIETSCDETAAAVVKDGRTVLSSVVASQVKVHHRYGGVVPELASRKHVEALVPVVSDALSKAGLSLDQIDALAVTRGPGLVGALLVGFSFAKACAFAKNIPWVGVNHLEGHIQAVFLESEAPAFPFAALLASGGHTGIYHVTSPTGFELLGQTRDDAAGEAFDKVAKMLDLGYPGGQVIDKLAARGDPAKIRFPRPYLDKADFDFSFSGIKTAVARYVAGHRSALQSARADIAAGFQEAVVEVLAYKVMYAARKLDCARIALVGGVAGNRRLRQKVRLAAAREEISVYIPSVHFCSDNAAMIAAAGYHYLKAGLRGDLNDDVFSR